VLNARNQGFVDAFISTNSEPPGYAAHRDAALQALTVLAIPRTMGPNENGPRSFLRGPFTI